MNSHDVQPDGELTPEQLKLVEELTDAEVQAIDDALLANTCDQWRKVTRVVGTTMMELPCQFRHPVKRGMATVVGKPSATIPPGTLASILKQAGLK